MFLSVCPSVYLRIYLSFCLSAIYLSIYLPLSLFSVACMCNGLGMIPVTRATYDPRSLSNHPPSPAAFYSCSFSVRGRGLWTLPLSILEYWLEWSCASDHGCWEVMGTAFPLCPNDTIAPSLLALRVLLCWSYQVRSDQTLLPAFTHSLQSLFT